MRAVLLFIVVLLSILLALMYIDREPVYEARRGQILATSTESIRGCNEIRVDTFKATILITDFAGDSAATFYGYETDGPYRINIINPNAGTFAHEATHAMQAIVKSRGIRDIETEAYIVGDITRKLMECYGRTN